MKKDWSNYVVTALLPFFVVAIVYAAEAFTRNAFFSCNNAATACESIPGNIWRVLRVDSGAVASSVGDRAGNDEEREVLAIRYSGRMAWFLLAEVFVYVCILSLGVASVLVFQLVPRRRALWVFGLLTLSMIVGLFFYRNPNIHMLIFLELFANAITPDLPAISDVTNILNSLGNAAIFSLLVAICATLLPSQEESFPRGFKELSMKMKNLQTILYTGTTLLVTGILLKKSIFQWSLAYTPQDDAIDEMAQNFVASFLAMDGGFYTLVLAAAYLPASLLLHRRVQVLVGQSPDQVEEQTRLKEYGLNFSLKESLPHLLAILAPFLTGPLAELFTANFLKGL